MYYTACLLLTIQWQLLCQAIVSLVYKWEGLLKIVWGGCNPLNPPPRSAPEQGCGTTKLVHTLHLNRVLELAIFLRVSDLGVGGRHLALPLYKLKPSACDILQL